MILIKSFLISVLIMEGILCSFTDCKTNKIPNVAILCGLVCSLIGNVLYFAISGTTLLLSFALNVASAGLLAFVMYALHIWAGGDVKLFVLLASLIPAEFLKQKTPLSIVTIYITAFSIAFIYLVAESIILKIKREKTAYKISFKFSIKAVLSCMVSIMALQAVLRLVFQTYYYIYLPFFLLLNVIFVLLFNKINFLSKNISIAICSVISVANIVFSIMNEQLKVDIKSIVVTLAVIVFRSLAEQFNYQEINTLDVKKGMILSYGTILDFTGSRVKGLPKFTTEDIATRISQDEADSIIRWANSKRGKDKIVILRKIPFAVFISIGFICYLVLGVFVW